MTVLEQDRHYLQLLSVFHNVVAGLTALFGCVPIFHLGIGLSLLFGGAFSEAAQETGDTLIMTLFALMFTLLPLALIVGLWGLALATAVSGYFIQNRRRRIFSIVVAAINCVLFPFGTVLGVFTLVVLVRPSVVTLYGGKTAVVVEEEE
jgi:hypothetical protein